MALSSGAAGRVPRREEAGMADAMIEAGSLAPELSPRQSSRSLAASLLVWGAAPGTACGWGVTSPCRVAQVCVNSAPKNIIRAE